jgi:hypothetical protein
MILTTHNDPGRAEYGEGGEDDEGERWREGGASEKSKKTREEKTRKKKTREKKTRVFGQWQVRKGGEQSRKAVAPAVAGAGAGAGAVTCCCCRVALLLLQALMLKEGEPCTESKSTLVQESGGVSGVGIAL